MTSAAAERITWRVRERTKVEAVDHHTAGVPYRTKLVGRPMIDLVMGLADVIAARLTDTGVPEPETVEAWA